MGDADTEATPRAFAVADRDSTADERDRTADAHDRASDARDDRSEARDARAVLREQKNGGWDPEAAADREGARRDRRGSANDRRHSEDDRDAASADRVRSAVERATLVVDGLTGAHQRDPGLAELERELVKAARTDQPFVLAFIDVDGLKNINDQGGHAAGDAVLQAVVSHVRGSVREYDLVVRYGGDEFLCGLLDVTLDEATRRFARQEATAAHDGRPAYTVGLAGFDGSETLADLVTRADQAMYGERASRAPA